MALDWPVAPPEAIFAAAGTQTLETFMSTTGTALSIGLVASCLSLAMLVASPAEARTKYRQQPTARTGYPVQYSYGTPGVYRTPIEPTPAVALPVGVPAFLGYAGTAAQAGTQVPLQHWSEFVAAFAASPADGYLAAAVRGFFENGGTLCHVVPLNDSTELAKLLSA